MLVSDTNNVNLIFQRPRTPPYLVRDTTRINALELTVQKMACDLTSSKEQIKEVKELLLQLINIPPAPQPTHVTAPASDSGRSQHQLSPPPAMQNHSATTTQNPSYFGEAPLARSLGCRAGTLHPTSKIQPSNNHITDAIANDPTRTSPS